MFLQNRRKRKRVSTRSSGCIRKHYLENFHESSNIELCVKCEIVDVGDQDCNLLFEPMKAIFQRIEGLVRATSVVCEAIIRAIVMRIAFILLVFRVLSGFRLIFKFFIVALFGDKAFDIFLCLPNSSSEFRSLMKNLGFRICSTERDRQREKEEYCTIHRWTASLDVQNINPDKTGRPLLFGNHKSYPVPFQACP